VAREGGAGRREKVSRGQKKAQGRYKSDTAHDKRKTQKVINKLNGIKSPAAERLPDFFAHRGRDSNPCAVFHSGSCFISSFRTSTIKVPTPKVSDRASPQPVPAKLGNPFRAGKNSLFTARRGRPARTVTQSEIIPYQYRFHP
jgi:hypothetical protein